LKFPKVVSCSQNGDERLFKFEISSELVWFNGHFPGYPVLPGIVQLRWAIEMSQQSFGFQSSPTEIKRLKFKNVAVPPVTLLLTLTCPGPAQTSFVYTGNEREYSQGWLNFAVGKS
jgi:3-hydroxymyristoyl/3-hydroxydecanoyl-(acyl carrier protein) dehydratase